jgi:hypothetical protein
MAIMAGQKGSRRLKNVETGELSTMFCIIEDKWRPLSSLPYKAFRIHCIMQLTVFGYTTVSLRAAKRSEPQDARSFRAVFCPAP